MTLSRKTKPLGPRQRRAYVKPFEDRLARAEAELAGLETAHAAYQRKQQRFSGAGVLKRNSGEVVLVELGHISAGYYGAPSIKTPHERKEARLAIMSGNVKVEIAGGSRGVPSLSKTVRALTKAQVRRLNALDRQIERAHTARNALIAGAFDEATPLTPEQLTNRIFDRLVLRAKQPKETYTATSAVQRAKLELAAAQEHNGTATCPCGFCVRERQNIQWQRDQAEREKTRAKERAKFEAAQKRSEAKILAKYPKTVTIDECERCGERTEDAEPQVDFDEFDDDGHPVVFVECERCEAGLIIEPTAKPAPGQEALALV